MLTDLPKELNLLHEAGGGNEFGYKISIEMNHLYTLAICMCMLISSSIPTVEFVGTNNFSLTYLFSEKSMWDMVRDL